MPSPTLPISCALALMLFACAADDGSDGNDELDTQASTSETTETSGDTDGTPLACGDVTCGPDMACLTFPQAPNCTELQQGEMCPEGTTESACGGAGIPCCCEPPPPTIYTCTPTDACGDTVDCSCLVDVCLPSCIGTAQELVFICEEPPAP